MIRINKTLIALAGAVVIPLAMLIYLANLPNGGRGTLGATLLQVAIVLGSVVLFGIFLARLLEQFNASRVRRWLASPEGQEWLAALPTSERADFLARLDGASPRDPAIEADSPVDSSEPSR